jgi:hypothetical protein
MLPQPQQHRPYVPGGVGPNRQEHDAVLTAKPLCRFKKRQQQPHDIVILRERHRLLSRDPVENIRVAVGEETLVRCQLPFIKLRQMRFGKATEQQVDLARATVTAAKNELFSLYGYIVFGSLLGHSRPVIHIKEV